MTDEVETKTFLAVVSKLLEFYDGYQKVIGGKAWEIITKEDPQIVGFMATPKHKEAAEEVIKWVTSLKESDMEAGNDYLRKLKTGFTLSDPMICYENRNLIASSFHAFQSASTRLQHDYYKANMKDVLSGVQSIEGKILKSSEKVTKWGKALKITVEVREQDGAYRVYGTAPKGLVFKVGDSIQMTATLTPVETGFGWFSKSGSAVITG